MLALKLRSHYSLLESINKIDKLVDSCSEQGFTSCNLMDIHSVSGAVDFSIRCQEKGIKPIIGCSLFVHGHGYLNLIARNKSGWLNLIQMISKSYDDNNFVKDTPGLFLEDIIGNDNLIALVGGTNDFVRNFAMSKNDVEYRLSMLSSLFPKSNIFFEESNNTSEDIKYNTIYSEIPQFKQARAQNCHYINNLDRNDLYVVLAKKYKTTLSKLDTNNYLVNNINNHSLRVFDSNILKDIDNMCEKYDITSAPRLPKFPCPNNLSEIDYLRQLARDGYVKKNKNWDRNIYGERAKEELGIIERSGLAGYFLIVQDYINYSNNIGWLTGPGRGSGAGSLISYLIGIIKVDPIVFGLLFERFYNEGRNVPGKIAYPDIDSDFPIEAREHIFSYLQDKYGVNQVCQLATFARLQGRGALKEVLRVHNYCDAKQIDEITVKLPQEAEISDLLEESGEESIIKWTLDNEPDRLKEYISINSDGELTGEMAVYFEQASRLEGTYVSQGKHAAGVIISSENLNNVCPMIKTAIGEPKIAGMEKDSLEKSGHLKFDILGVSALSKIILVDKLLKGEING